MEPFSHNMMRLGVATVWNEQRVFDLLGAQRQYFDQFIDAWKANDPYQQRIHIPYVRFATETIGYFFLEHLNESGAAYCTEI
ncbi:unnamed protein product [Gongylonema pulchrum]|uniref:N-acylglucosamine 2-epimerase n=1 Tax=Gongylonema pulchrum TaxID=637853 RepID=A0A183CXB5_9BILA|nr:unnamed protein product [Gongylonema pulchrum]